MLSVTCTINPPETRTLFLPHEAGEAWPFSTGVVQQEALAVMRLAEVTPSEGEDGPFVPGAGLSAWSSHEA